MRQKRAKMSISTYKVTHGWLSTERLLHSCPPFSRSSATDDVYAWLLGVMENVKLEWRNTFCIK